MKKTLRSHLLLLADIKLESSGMSRAAISRAALNDNTFLTRVDRGENFTIGNFDKVVRWLSENWPDGIDWPADIERPAPESVEASS